MIDAPDQAPPDTEPSEAKTPTHRLSERGPYDPMVIQARQRLTAYMKSIDLSQNALGKKCVPGQSTINRILSAKDPKVPRLDTVNMLCKALQLPMWSLFVPGLDPNEKAIRRLGNVITWYLQLGDEDRYRIEVQLKELSESRR